MGYDWNFAFLGPYESAFLRGTVIAIELSLASFLIGTTVGILGGTILRILPIRSFFLLLNDAIRAIPVLVLLFFVYYFPSQQLFGVKPPSPLVSAIVAISFSQAAYTADIVRAAIDAVPQGTILGARALGLREITILRYIIIPDVIRQILPAEVAFLIGIVRITSVASVIGCEEVVYVARVATSQNYRSLEAWTVVACVYIALVLPLTVIHRWLERCQWLKRRA